MNEDEKMFSIGIMSFVVVMVLTFALQVCYREQNRERTRIRNQIVQTQQEIAVAEATHAAFLRPESLGNLVSGVVPRAEPISFHKTVEIQNLPDRMN